MKYRILYLKGQFPNHFIDDLKTLNPVLVEFNFLDEFPILE